METISFEDFKKVEIKIGKIVSAQKVENSEKLLVLEVDFGQDLDGQPCKRQIVSGIAKYYAIDDLIGKECPFVVNLEPKTLAGLESQGMILCADDETPVLLHPQKEVKEGSIVK